MSNGFYIYTAYGSSLEEPALVSWSSLEGWTTWQTEKLPMPYEEFVAMAKSGERLHEFDPTTNICMGCGMTHYASTLTKNLFCASPPTPPKAPIELPAGVIERAFNPRRRG